MTIKSKSLLKSAFILGAILDIAIGISWFFIASGVEMPNILCGYTGIGQAYQFAMYVAGMFLVGWGVILGWCSIKPVERRGIILITAVLLFLSILGELVFFMNILGGTGFIFGIFKRSFLVILFTYSYVKSYRNNI
jgi:hypothetical protein